VLDWLDHPTKAAAVEQRFTELHHTLRRNTAQAAADAIAQVIESR
jgi:lipid-A-disaccharide synthase